jgi:SWI/SNF related-matrix-associated actin-dependent regulator of chromatin subfamily C
MDSPKCTTSPSPSSLDTKHIRLNVLPQNQGAIPINLENAPGKHAKLDPVQAIELSNLPNDLPPQPGLETGGKVKVVKGEGKGEEEMADIEMAEGGEEESKIRLASTLLHRPTRSSYPLSQHG